MLYYSVPGSIQVAIVPTHKSRTYGHRYQPGPRIFRTGIIEVEIRPACYRLQ